MTKSSPEDPMHNMVSIDPDLPAVERWKLMAIFDPDMAVDLAKIYGTKEDVKHFKKRQETHPDE